eukprot:CAMPEP_0171472452 /NCGR_PEP_ID=MMETSP0946-20130122/1282_1 /TAXON_ID=109269 /ORGANISM="Vaucheria litorea, Strain CCMP2940" /LENGTH=178 /DNA_ID=CAMNT_0012002083 /DNA_START=238 /DNA_END=774 /DNA_ORIENTATION=-
MTVRLRVKYVPIILVMKVLVVVVVEYGWIFFVLNESLHSVSGEELSVRFLNAPVELGVDLSRRGVREEVYLAVENVEKRVEAGANVPPSIENAGVERLGQGFERRDRVGVVVFLLWHALLLAQGTGVELSHHFVFEQVPALNLALRFVRLARARLDADEVAQALWVQQTLRQLGFAAV